MISLLNSFDPLCFSFPLFYALYCLVMNSCWL